AVGTGAAKLIAAHPKAAAGVAAGLGAMALKKKISADLRKRCYDKHEGYPDRIRRCLAGQR
ncbi:hypothetical protein KAR91_11545, partial [Candidatus Pacearchaeota archaeon]|nr:hypothetical protein [Candidatus Pacearchaeota archaeon]